MIAIFAAAAQARVNELTNSAGLSSRISDFLGSRFLRRGFWNSAGTAVGRLGLAVMDVGSIVVGVGWKIVLYGFFAWAGAGIVRNLGRLVGVLGSEVLRSIPPAIEIPA